MNVLASRARGPRRYSAAIILAATAVLALVPARANADWWSDNFEIHGFLRSRAYLRSRSLDLSREAKISSWRTELDLEPTVHLYSGDRLQVTFFGVFRPTYDAVYDLNPHLWGEDARGGRFGSAPFDFTFRTGPSVPLGASAGTVSATSPIALALAGPGPTKDLRQRILGGGTFPGHGAGIEGEAFYANADALTLFSGFFGRSEGPPVTSPMEFVDFTDPNGLDLPKIRSVIDGIAGIPATPIDGTAEFGAEVAPILPRGSRQAALGGQISALPYEASLASNARILFAFDQAYQALLRSGFLKGFGSSAPQIAAGFAASSVTTSTNELAASLANASRPLGTPFTPYGDASSFKQSPFDINRTQAQLAWDCRDNAHPGCFVREAYFDITYKHLFVRIGKQEVIWGKTDGFQLQDIVNPRDLGQHNIFPFTGDKDRRIPQLALDAQVSFGDVGPLEDVSLEFVWNFDKFLPAQFGQCGEPYAFAISCVTRDQVALHEVLGIGLASSQRIPWKFTNTEPGLRLQFRLSHPAVSVSVSAYWGFQDLPVQKLVNRYSFENPNRAALLFVQGQAAGLASLGGAFGLGADLSAFDPYGDLSDPTSDISRFNSNLRGFYRATVQLFCAGKQGPALGRCLDQSGASVLALPWTGGEFELVYPRVLTLGGSADYEIPKTDTIVRAELAYDFNEGIQDTSALPTLMRKSDVLRFAIGLDRQTLIPFLNPNRTAFLSFQTFLSHIVDYGNHGFGTGTVLPETQLISTAFMMNYWRNDRVTLFSFVAYDWSARAWAGGPQLTWQLGEHLSLEGGVNVLFGSQDHVHNLVDLCPGGALTLTAGAACRANDPTTWRAGQTQLSNRDAARFSESPWLFLQSFADRFMEDRDEVWMGFTYQF